MISQEHYDTLEQRMRYLQLRERIKQELGWETEYERREHEALAAALALLRPLT